MRKASVLLLCLCIAVGWAVIVVPHLSAQTFDSSDPFDSSDQGLMDVIIEQELGLGNTAPAPSCSFGATCVPPAGIKDEDDCSMCCAADGGSADDCRKCCNASFPPGSGQRNPCHQYCNAEYPLGHDDNYR